MYFSHLWNFMNILDKKPQGSLHFQSNLLMWKGIPLKVCQTCKEIDPNSPPKKDLEGFILYDQLLSED